MACAQISTKFEIFDIFAVFETRGWNVLPQSYMCTVTHVSHFLILVSRFLRPNLKFFVIFWTTIFTVQVQIFPQYEIAVIHNTPLYLKITIIPKIRQEIAIFDRKTSPRISRNPCELFASPFHKHCVSVIQHNIALGALKYIGVHEWTPRSAS